MSPRWRRMEKTPPDLFRLVPRRLTFSSPEPVLGVSANRAQLPGRTILASALASVGARSCTQRRRGFHRDRVSLHEVRAERPLHRGSRADRHHRPWAARRSAGAWSAPAILALEVGYQARNQIDQSGGQQAGRGLAVVGIVLGWVGVAAFILMLIALAARRVTSTKARRSSSSHRRRRGPCHHAFLG